MTIKIQIVLVALSVKRHLLKSLLSKTDGESVGKKKGVVIPKVLRFMFAFGYSSTTEGRFPKETVTSFAESLNASWHDFSVLKPEISG